MRVGTESRGCAWLARDLDRADVADLPLHAALPRRRVAAASAAAGGAGEVRRRPAHERAGADPDRARRSPGWRWRSRRPWAIALAAIFSAGVASNNFYGATALAIFYPILIWAFWITRQDKRILAAGARHSRAGLRPHGVLAGAVVLQGHRGEHEVRLRARHHLVHLGRGGGGHRLRRRPPTSSPAARPRAPGRSSSPAAWCSSRSTCWAISISISA